MRRKGGVPRHQRERQGRDPATRTLYFGCGGLLGLVVGAGYCLGATEADGWDLLLYMAAFFVAFGLVSMLAGDRFWDNLDSIFNRY